MAVELAHGEGVVGLEVISLWEGVHAVGLIRVRHAPHLVDLDGHAGGSAGSQAGAVLVRSGYGAAGGILRDNSVFILNFAPTLKRL